MRRDTGNALAERKLPYVGLDGRRFPPTRRWLMHLSTWAAVTCLMNVAAAELQSGQRYRVTGIWDGLEVLSQQQERLDATEDVQADFVAGRIDGVDPQRRQIYIGPLAIAWDDSTRFDDLRAGELRPDERVAMRIRRSQSAQLVALSIGRDDDDVANRLELIGTVRIGTVSNPNDILYTIFDVPIRYRAHSEAMSAAASPEVAAPAAAPATTLPDISDWECKYCLFDFGTASDVRVGTGHVFTDRIRFGQYTGLEEGAFAMIDWRLRGWNESGGFWNIALEAPGGDWYVASVGAGRQGGYGIALDYERLPVRIQDTSKTPYAPGSDGTLFLARDWVTADSTDGMAVLQRDLRSLDLQAERDRITLRGYLFPSRNWQLSVKYRHEEKSGQYATGGAIGGPLIAAFPFLTRSALVQLPLDYVTDSVDATLAYYGETAHFALDYSASLFDENADVVTWQNAFLDPTGSDTEFGRILLPANNEAHQLALSAGFRLSPATRINGRLAAGRMVQDDRFLPFTVNPGLALALPIESLDGKVDTLRGQLRIASRPTPKLSLTAVVDYDDRENVSDRATFGYVITDTIVSATPRTNLPYSYTRSSADLSATYRLARSARVSVGYAHDERERTFQDIDRNTEDAYFGQLMLAPGSSLDIVVKYTRADRDGSNLELQPEIQPAPNPLLRKFNMATRVRDMATARVGISPRPGFSVGLTAEYANDDYEESLLGLTESRDISYTLDVSIVPGARARLHGFVAYQNVESTQLGSEAFAVADWTAISKDTFDTAGVTMEFGAPDDKISFGLEYFFAQSTGQIDLESATSALVQLPDLETQLHNIQAFLDFRATERLSIRFGYIFEDYEAFHWGIDGVLPNTIPSVLSLGEQSFAYDAHVPMISFRYRPISD